MVADAAQAVEAIARKAEADHKQAILNAELIISQKPTVGGDTHDRGLLTIGQEMDLKIRVLDVAIDAHGSDGISPVSPENNEDIAQGWKLLNGQDSTGLHPAQAAAYSVGTLCALVLSAIATRLLIRTK